MTKDQALRYVNMSTYEIAMEIAGKIDPIVMDINKQLEDLMAQETALIHSKRQFSKPYYEQAKQLYEEAKQIVETVI